MLETAFMASFLHPAPCIFFSRFSLLNCFTRLKLDDFKHSVFLVIPSGPYDAPLKYHASFGAKFSRYFCHVTRILLILLIMNGSFWRAAFSALIR